MSKLITVAAFILGFSSLAHAGKIGSTNNEANVPEGCVVLSSDDDGGVIGMKVSYFCPDRAVSVESTGDGTIITIQPSSARNTGVGPYADGAIWGNMDSGDQED
jgi:hypothetical protein